MRLARMLIVGLVFTLAPGLIDSTAHAQSSFSPPVTVDRTGTTDVSAELQAFFKSVPDGSTITFSPGSTYRIEGSLIFSGRKNLTIDGSGATFIVTTDGTNATQGRDHSWWGRSWPRKRGQFIFQGGSGITLDNLTIDGANDGAGAHNDAFVVELEAQHAVEFFGTKDSVIRNCTIAETYGDPVSVSGNSQHITVENCDLRRAGRQGVTVDRAQHVTIRNNTITDIGRSAIDLEPARADWTVEHVTIANNTIGRANGVFIAAHGNGPVNHITITDNTLRGEQINILVKDAKGARRHHWTITDNTTDSIVGSPLAPIRTINVDHVTITGNYQPIASTQSRRAIDLRDLTTATIHSNDFPIHDTRDARRPKTGESADIIVNGALLQQPIRLPVAGTSDAIVVADEAPTVRPGSASAASADERSVSGLDDLPPPPEMQDVDVAASQEGNGPPAGSTEGEPTVMDGDDLAAPSSARQELMPPGVRGSDRPGVALTLAAILIWGTAAVAFVRTRRLLSPSAISMPLGRDDECGE